jgi:hypothetical protein
MSTQIDKSFIQIQISLIQRRAGFSITDQENTIVYEACIQFCEVANIIDPSIGVVATLMLLVSNNERRSGFEDLIRRTTKAEMDIITSLHSPTVFAPGNQPNSEKDPEVTYYQ